MRAAGAKLTEIAFERLFGALLFLLQLRQNFVDHHSHPSVWFRVPRGWASSHVTAALHITRDRPSFHGFDLFAPRRAQCRFRRFVGGVPASFGGAPASACRAQKAASASLSFRAFSVSIRA